ncbi:MAG: FhaA domain-containing protein [Anaerolineales bacterium]
MNLQDLEARLQALIEVRLISVLPGQKAEDLLVQKLTGAMRTSAVADERGRLIAPNVYTLLAHPDSIAYWKNPKLLETLIDILKAAAKQGDVRFEFPPSITIAEDAAVAPGDFNLIASFRAAALAETKDLKANMESDPTEHEGDGIPESAFVIVEGVKVVQLNEAVVNIGRRLDNTIVVDDPRVSRNHAQLRAIKGRFVLFDLNSTGGTFVNGQRANQTILYPGDVISLAGVSLIFGQDNPHVRPDLSDTTPGTPASANRSTAVIRTNPQIAKKRK